MDLRRALELRLSDCRAASEFWIRRTPHHVSLIGSYTTFPYIKRVRGFDHGISIS